jgi:hypothetical protein
VVQGDECGPVNKFAVLSEVVLTESWLLTCER